MNKIRNGAKPTALHIALAMSGLIVASTMAHGQSPAGESSSAIRAQLKNAVKDRKQDASVNSPKESPACKVLIGKDELRETDTPELPKQKYLKEGESVLIQLCQGIKIGVGDPKIAEIKQTRDPLVKIMFGKTVGSTSFIFWDKPNKPSSVDVTVVGTGGTVIDVVALQSQIDQLLPSEKDKIKVKPVADTIVLYGTASDVVKADRAVELANAALRKVVQAGLARQQLAVAGAYGGTSGPAQQQIAAVGATGQGTDATRGQQSNGALAAAIGGNAPSGGVGGPKVINMLSIDAPQQVMLEVKVAEVSKTLVDQLGASIGATKTLGSWTYSLLSNLLSNNPSLIDGFNNKNGNFLTLDAQKRDGLVKVLAEPTIMAISGQMANFVAGGKVFIPVSQSNNGGVPTIGLEEKKFGIMVEFTPTVLDGGRINLKVASEVSDLNKDGIGITAAGVTGTAIFPSFTVRNATTTVQLKDGQSFAIGGLIKNNVTTNIKAFPLLGEIPVLGALFRSSDFQTDRSELVFIITPHLVKPLPPDYRLPTDLYIEPSRSEFFLGGKMEGAAPQHEKKAAGPATGFELK